MRLQLTLLLLCAACLAADANVGDMPLSDMSLKRTLLAAECPIQFCNSGRNCIYSSRTKKWRCTACTGVRIPNAAKSECVCPAGTFPTSDGGCSQCKDNMYCPQGQLALRSTAKACPANMVTLRRGAKSINDCFNAPGYSFRKTSDGIKANACGVNSWTTGLKKQTTCTACLTGFKTDPETVPGSHTNSDVCQAPAGSFVTGSTVTLCPKGEYSDDYSLATSCKTCEDLFNGPGITTAREGSTSANNCTWLEPGYALMDDKKRTILGAFDPINMPLAGAKKCPQNFYCPGGDPNAEGKPVRCPNGMWTEDEGAASEDECVAPPGMYLPDGLLTATDKLVRHCPQGTYKETWQRVGIAGCLACGTGAWLSDRTIFLNDLDPNTGLVRQQIGVRGSTDSCYIQRGMGAVQEKASNSTSSEIVLRAIACPANYYGVVGVAVEGVFKKYGKVATPCTQCPTNMITAGLDGKVTNIKAPAADGQALVDAAVAATDGYWTVESCFTQPGYGYYQGASQLCAEGFWSAGMHKLPCTQCPFGKTTNFANSINADSANCTKYIAGYGLLNDIPQPCAIGLYQAPQVDVGTACSACPASLTTSAVGGASLAACNLCAAGYGNIAQNTTCGSCQDGYYGTSDRKDNKCTKCPGGRSFSYDYNGVDDVFTPEVTSKPYSASQADCVADFSQTVEGAFSLDLTAGAGLVSVAARENLQSCVQECRDNSKCVAATFDYDSLECKNWVPDTKESFVANGGVAFKLVSSTNLASSVKAAEMGSGEYNYIPDGVNTPARINPTSLTPVATGSLKACLKACSNVNLCAGVVFGQFSGEDSIPASSCKLIMGQSKPGSSLRTLIKANFMGLATNLKVSAGYFSQPGGTSVAICPPSVAGANGYFCPGGAAPGAAPRQQCAALNDVGTYMPAGTETADDCSAWLSAGYYYDTTTGVTSCTADYYCPGGENKFGATANVGRYACPVGTKSVTGSDSMEDCNELYDGYYYQAPGAISATTIKSCDEGFWCNTEDLAIVVDTTTPAVLGGGRNACPVGSSSTAGVYPAAGPKVIGDCTRLLAGFEYAGTAISEANINTCAADTFCAGERTIVGSTAIPGTPCIEGTGVAKKALDTDKGASSANDCLKLYEGYYYTGVGTEISRTSVLPCPANKFCTGWPNIAKTIVRGAPSLPTDCPTGTKVAVGVAFADDTAFFNANGAARAITSAPPGSPTNSAANAGGRNVNDCNTLKASYFYDGTGAISTSTVKLCTADFYCNTEGVAITVNTPTAAAVGGGINACPTGVNSLEGSKTINDCNILEAGYFYTGPAGTAISGTSVTQCLVKFYCPGGNVVDVATSGKTGDLPCAGGSTTTAVGQDAANDCTVLRPGFFYTGGGAISDNTVVACPDDFFCRGTVVSSVSINPASTAVQGREACPVGSGSPASSSTINACLKIYPGYYFQGDATACTTADILATGGKCSYTVCDTVNGVSDSTTQKAFCPGLSTWALDVTTVQSYQGRTLCGGPGGNSNTRTQCDVLTPGQDCTKDADCVSP
ncbi:hypothetical protein OEZ86_005923 [Tetradesmus obliquus]|nr:hypothetical protein OEZ86_005923 [Tetradesmus obliquus]